MPKENVPLVGRVTGNTPRITAAQYTRPASATTYTAGDIIGNSATAASVTPLEFPLPRASGRITGASCTLLAASGTVVAPFMSLLLFRPVTSIPLAAAGYPADNGVLNITAAMMRELVAEIPFLATNWRGQLGSSTPAGLQLWQDAILARRPYAPFNLENIANLADLKLIGVLQDLGGWAPGNIVNTFDIVLDVDLD